MRGLYEDCNPLFPTNHQQGRGLEVSISFLGSERFEE